MAKNKMEIENIFSSNKHLLEGPEVKELIGYTIKLQEKKNLT